MLKHFPLIFFLVIQGYCVFHQTPKEPVYSTQPLQFEIYPYDPVARQEAF